MSQSPAGHADEFAAYERGLGELLRRLGSDTAGYADALTFQQRLSENIDLARRYGNTEAYTAERAVIVAQLNRLALSELGVAFNDLCASDDAEHQPQSQLAMLPLVLPEHTALPAGSRMTFGRNMLFTGRADDLRTLAATLNAGDTAAIAAATGMGGIGKTQLAVEFVHRYGQFFAGGVFWLSFANADSVSIEAVACGLAGELGLPSGFADMQLAAQIGLIMRVWEQPMPRLLVFDNCEETALLAQWRPRSGGCRVLLTSRRADWETELGVQALALEVLRRAESVALLQKSFEPRTKEPRTREPRTENRALQADTDALDDALRSTLDAIAAELGDLPLALHLAGSYLKNNRHDVAPAEYLAELRSAELLKHPSLVGEDLVFSATNHTLHIGRTFALSYDQLDATKALDDLALALLARAAHLAPGEPIPRDLLRATVDTAIDKRQIGKALRRLLNLGLIEEERDGALRLHRLLSAFVRGLRSDDAARTAVEQVLVDTTSRLNKAGIPAPLIALQSHLRVVTDNAMVREDVLAADLCINMGYYLQNMLGDLAGARAYYERDLTINRKALGARHRSTATSLNNLGLLLQAQGDLAGARTYLEHALDINREVLGARHPDTAQSLNNLGVLLRLQGDLAGAWLYYEQALDIYREALGERHPDTATSLSNLGGLLRAQGDYAGARSYYEQALDIRREILGARHPDTARSLNNLGILLQAQGDLVGARPYLEQSLDIRREVLGARHPDTARSLNNLATLCFYEGTFQEAAVLMRQALAIREEMLGPQHPDTQSSRRSLAAIEERLAREQGGSEER